MEGPFENDYNVQRLESILEELGELGYGFYGALYKMDDTGIPVFDFQILDGTLSADEKVDVVTVLISEDEELKPLNKNQYVFVN